MRVLIFQNYTDYITNKERVTGPISASKLFFDNFILHNFLYRLNWENQYLYYVLRGGGEGGGGLTMVSGKGYKGGPLGSVVKLANTPSPLQTISKN